MVRVKELANRLLLKVHVYMLEDQIPVAELRNMYVRGNLRQRYNVAAEGIRNPGHGPNQVVTSVAALEGLARAIAVKHLVAQGSTLDGAYQKLRWAKPIELLEKHVLPSLDTTPEQAFDSGKWELLPKAVEFRNLLVHEATYLHGGTCTALIEATCHVFERIAELSGAKPAAT